MPGKVTEKVRTRDGSEPPKVCFRAIGVTFFTIPTDPSKGSRQYFEGTMIPSFFEPHCSHCHWSDRSGSDRLGAPGEGVDIPLPPLNYDIFEEATARTQTTWRRVTSQDAPMPPMGRVPSPDEMEMLRIFLSCNEPSPDLPDHACGAPYDALTSGLGTCPSDSTLVYADVEQILQTYCTDCHSTELTGDARSGAPESRNWNTATEAASGDLAHAWRRICDLEMPDGDGGALSVEEATALREWWACGAPSPSIFILFWPACGTHSPTMIPEDVFLLKSQCVH